MHPTPQAGPGDAGVWQLGQPAACTGLVLDEVSMKIDIDKPAEADRGLHCSPRPLSAGVWPTGRRAAFVQLACERAWGRVVPIAKRSEGLRLDLGRGRVYI